MEKILIGILLLTIGIFAIGLKIKEKKSEIVGHIIEKEVSNDVINIIDKLEKSVKFKQFSTYDEAISAAKSTNRNIFLYFEASWCSWCKTMKNKTINELENTIHNKNYIICCIDIDKNQDLAKRYNIKQIPSYFIINNNEQIIKYDSGYKNKEDFLNWINPNKVSYLQR